MTIDLSKLAPNILREIYGASIIEEQWLRAVEFTTVGSKGSVQVPVFTPDTTLGDCCTSTDNSGITTKQFPVICLQKDITLCKSDIDAILQNTPDTAGDNLGSMNGLLKQIAYSFKEGLTNIAFNGRTTPTVFEGYLSLGTTTALTSTEIYAAVKELVSKMPAGANGNLLVFVGEGNYRTLLMDLAAANLYNYSIGSNDGNSPVMLPPFSNVQLIPVGGSFPSDVIFATPQANILHFGKDINADDFISIYYNGANKYTLTVSAYLGVAIINPALALVGEITTP